MNTRAPSAALLGILTVILIVSTAGPARHADAGSPSDRATVFEPDQTSQCTWSEDYNLPDFDGSVLTSVVWDDGTGPTLYVGGEFRRHGKRAVPYVARWTSQGWRPLLAPNGIGLDGPVQQLIVYDDGYGEALFAGGEFVNAGGQTVNRVARWDGRSWSSLPGGNNVGIDGRFAAMAVHDFDYGDVLCIGEHFKPRAENSSTTSPCGMARGGSR